MPKYTKRLCVVSEPIDDCTDAITSRPKHTEGYVQRKYLHFFDGDYDLSGMDFATATSLLPVDDFVRHRMDKLGFMLGMRVGGD